MFHEFKCVIADNRLQPYRSSTNSATMCAANKACFAILECDTSYHTSMSLNILSVKYSMHGVEGPTRCQVETLVQSLKIVKLKFKI